MREYYSLVSFKLAYAPEGSLNISTTNSSDQNENRISIVRSSSLKYSSQQGTVEEKGICILSVYLQIVILDTLV